MKESIWDLKNTSLVDELRYCRCRYSGGRPYRLQKGERTVTYRVQHRELPFYTRYLNGVSLTCIED